MQLYSHRKGCRKRFDFKLFDVLIPYDDKPFSLGITFDECLNFRPHVQKLKDMYAPRLNIICILSHKSWKLEKNTLISLFKVLIGSVLDYSSFICSGLSDELTSALQAVQNAAVRAIYHVPGKTSTHTQCSMANLDKVITRMEELNRRYLQNAIRNTDQRGGRWIHSRKKII